MVMEMLWFGVTLLHQGSSLSYNPLWFLYLAVPTRNPSNIAQLKNSPWWSGKNVSQMVSETVKIKKKKDKKRLPVVVSANGGTTRYRVYCLRNNSKPNCFFCFFTSFYLYILFQRRSNIDISTCVNIKTFTWLYADLYLIMWTPSVCVS